MAKPDAQNTMDELLSNLPLDSPSPELALRICQVIHLRRRRRMRIRLSMGVVFALVGLWLTVPDLAAWIGSISIPQSGLPVLQSWVNIALAGVETTMENAMSGLVWSQATISSLARALPGVLALALSALLVLDYLLPRIEA